MVITRDEETVRDGFWPKLAKVLANIPFAEDAVAAYYCAFDSRTPLRVKGILLAALVYFIMPADIIPDFLLGLGFTDDLSGLSPAERAKIYKERAAAAGIGRPAPKE